MGTFEVNGGGFVRDGREHRVLSGALHYFRVRPQQWRHRLGMLRAMGLNTVETYVPWNLHEPKPGEFALLNDLPAFLEAAAQGGLDAIVRPGPYICAEWDNGGLPSWLTGQPGIRIRCLDERYLSAVDSWFDQLIPLVAEHQVTRGGNVIMVQVENEYGSYGSDQAYLRHLADGLTRRGIDVPLFTSDGPEDFMLTGGTIPGVLATVNFGSEPEQAFKTFRGYRESDPLFCMEFWCGWFDHWGNEHVTRDPADAADTLKRMLDAGASVNIYMAHGGTNFGLWAGANRPGADHLGVLKADVTSYDYDAPIDERGGPTEKYWKFREVLQTYAAQPLPDVPELPPLLPEQTVTLTETLPLLTVLQQVPATASGMPLSFEDLGVHHGVVLYRTAVPGPRASYPLTADGLDGIAHVFSDGHKLATLDETAPTLPFDVPAQEREVSLLVESMGRVNYGPLTGESKGLKGLRHGQQFVHGFTAHPLALEDISALPWELAAETEGAAFSRGTIELTEPRDTFVEIPHGTKGYVWVNGFALGRYWNIGPQQRLYLPWPLLCQGRNEIVVLDLTHPVRDLAFKREAQ
ncbi:glycoside hydrolase family 35 protein [Catelliglobosispora koreensis]|uniref:glycoside hydrolase family 35 protein n=1 Tax=Catelliglobosispora koreensis TaxID=129052 RepID=UPI000360554F|nr:beta-galactosidase family protein [Catelliglobosispora koreensis]